MRNLRYFKILTFSGYVSQNSRTATSEKGKISFVLPYEAGKTLINSTALYCIKQTNVITKIGKDPQRMLLTFSRENLPQVKDSLVIYDENNQYTEAFIALTKAFYLKM